MKFKPLVILSGLLVLITLTVYVSVHAWNVYASAGESGGYAGCNAWGLWNGSYSVKVMVDGKVPPPDEDGIPHAKAGGYIDGTTVSEGVSYGNPNNESFFARAYVSGTDPTIGEHITEEDFDFYPGGK